MSTQAAVEALLEETAREVEMKDAERTASSACHQSPDHRQLETRTPSSTTASSKNENRSPHPQLVLEPCTAVSRARAISAPWSSKACLQSTSPHCRRRQVREPTSSTAESRASTVWGCRWASSAASTTKDTSTR